MSLECAAEAYWKEQAEENASQARYWEGKVSQCESMLRGPSEVWVITYLDGSVYGVYENEDTAEYAFKTAPGGCYPPVKKAVLRV